MSHKNDIQYFIEKRVFYCKKRGYKVHVYGETYFDSGCYNYMATFRYKKCKVLFGNIISKSKWLKEFKLSLKGISEMRKYSIEEVLAFDLADEKDNICLLCGGSFVEVWNRNEGVCTRCGEKMDYSP